MDKLSELAIKYKADKFGKHNYTPFYYELFKDKNVKKVIELGTAEGASIFMWHDFFPNAKIYGADIEPERVLEEDLKKFPRIKVFACDQRYEVDMIKLIKQTGTDIDLFIDDGSHRPDDQLFSCLFIMPMLDKDSIYIIEDVFDESIADEIVKAGYEVEVKKFSNRYDDRVIVVKQ